MVRRRGLGTPWEGAGGQEEEAFPCSRARTRWSHQMEALVASSQTEAFGAEPQAPWAGKTHEFGKVKPGLFVSPEAS